MVGDVALMRRLNELKGPSVARILKPGFRKAAQGVKKEAQRLVNEDTGSLRKAISYSVRKSRRGGVYAKIYIKRRRYGNNKPSDYAHFVEFGTRKQPARPFLRAAQGNRKGRTKILIQTETKKELAKEVARLRRRYR